MPIISDWEPFVPCAVLWVPIGVNLAKLHLVPAERLPEKGHWLANNYLASAIEAAQQRFGEDRLQDYLRMYERIKDFTPASFPQSIVHGDLYAANCLFRGDELCAFLDWEEVGTGASLLDFARSVLGFCFVDQDDGSIQFADNLYTNLFDGYMKVRTLTDEEQRHIEIAVKYA